MLDAIARGLFFFDLALLIGGGAVAITGLVGPPERTSNRTRITLGLAMIGISLCLLVVLFVWAGII